MLQNLETKGNTELAQIAEYFKSTFHIINSSIILNNNSCLAPRPYFHNVCIGKYLNQIRLANG